MPNTAKFTEDLYDANGAFVKTVEWTTIGEPTTKTVQVMHPPTYPIDPEYARKYDAYVARQQAAGRPWR